MCTFVVVRKDGTEVEFRHLGALPGSVVTTRIEGRLLIVTDRYFRSQAFRLDEIERCEMREIVLPSQQQDKIEGLQADLESAVEVVFNRGGEEWVRMNYPALYARLAGQDEQRLRGSGRADPAEGHLPRMCRVIRLFSWPMASGGKL